MIKYALRCSEGHSFEDWFASSSAYDALAEAGELRCPECGSPHITKAIMAPNLGKKAAPQPACGAPACANMGCPAMAG